MKPQGRMRRALRGRPQLQGQRLTCYAPQHPFRRFGRCGHEIAEIFPHVGSVADELCVIRSMKTEAINHDPAHTFMNTGTTISGRPSMGSWLLYGLGSDAEDLPVSGAVIADGADVLALQHGGDRSQKLVLVANGEVIAVSQVIGLP